jgi:superfamily II DNA or RNA helicase
MVEYRDYQLDIIERGANIINEHGFLYLAMEVRTGKTLTSFGICERIGAQNVLFLTKKKAISSITGDLDKLCPSYVTFVINYESIHKLPSVNWDVIVCDEAHSMGAFPKPSKRAKDVASLIYKNKSRVILLSGTPTPESYSQMYHQVYGIPTNPFSKYKNFYGFARDYVNILSLIHI